MKFVSMKRGERKNNGSFESLIGITGKIISIRVVSAYFDLPSIEQLLEYVKLSGHAKARKEMIVVIDYMSSKFQSDADTRGKLQKLNDEIRKYCTNDKSGIYLAKSGPLFHSKGYLVSTTKNGRLTVGSMNLTQKALRKNEEIMLSGEYIEGSRELTSALANEFYAYIDELVEGSINGCSAIRADRVDVKVMEKPKNLREMFLDGRLYYERKEQDPFRFDLRMPDSMRQSTSNISDLLESTTKNSIDISKIVTQILGYRLPEIGYGKSMWKKFCVETCYGYWSPSFYYEQEDDDCLKRQLDIKKGKRSEYYLKLHQYVQANHKSIYERLSKIINDIAQRAETEGYEELDKWEFLREGRLPEVWARWRENLDRKMKDDSFIERLCTSISSASMPDIWEDVIAAGEFTESFFESILYKNKISSKATENWPAYSISENIGHLEEISEWKSLSDKVEAFLRDSSDKSIFSW